MAGHNINSTGNNLLAPVGKDMEQHCHRLLEDSWRLFSTQENRLDVFRLLSANGGTKAFKPHSGRYC